MLRTIFVGLLFSTLAWAEMPTLFQPPAPPTMPPMPTMAPPTFSCDPSQAQCTNPGTGTPANICCPAKSNCALSSDGKTAIGCVVAQVNDCTNPADTNCGIGVYGKALCCPPDMNCGYVFLGGSKKANGCVDPGVVCPTDAQECKNASGEVTECCASTETCNNGTCVSPCPSGQFTCGSPPTTICCNSGTEICTPSSKGGETCQPKPTNPGRCTPPQYPCAGGGDPKAPAPATMCCNPEAGCVVGAPQPGHATCCPPGWIIAPTKSGGVGCFPPDSCGGQTCSSGTYCCNASGQPAASGPGLHCCPYPSPTPSPSAIPPTKSPPPTPTASKAPVPGASRAPMPTRR